MHIERVEAYVLLELVMLKWYGVCWDKTSCKPGDVPHAHIPNNADTLAGSATKSSFVKTIQTANNQRE